jgi:TRAP-type C4-dicarboxylate transport system permease small subunit
MATGASESGQSAVESPLLARVAQLCILIAGVALCGLALVQGWQVFARYVLNDSPSWTEPVALLLMNFAMMFGAAAGVRAGAHFGFFLLPHATHGLTRRLLEAVAHLVCAGIALLLAVWAARLVIDGWDVLIAGASLPKGLNFVPLTCAGVLMALFSFEALWAKWR